MLEQLELCEKINVLSDRLERLDGRLVTEAPQDIYNNELLMRQYSLTAQSVVAGKGKHNMTTRFTDGIGIFKDAVKPDLMSRAMRLYKEQPDLIEWVNRKGPTGGDVKSSSDIYLRFHCMGDADVSWIFSSLYEAVTRAVMAYLWNYPGSLFYNAQKTHLLGEQHNIYDIYDYFSQSMFVDAPQLQRYKANRDGYPLYHAEWTPSYHARRRRLAYIVYLNDVKNGGETVFLNQKERIHPKAGTIVVFPAWDTHLHKGAMPLSNDKYIATGWVNTLPEEPR